MPVRLKDAKERVESLDPIKVKDYEDYFKSLCPKDLKDVFKRWIFAYASVHTGWEANCKMYESLAPLDWIGNAKLLKERIIESKAGMHNQRTRFITEFTAFFWRHPTWFNKTEGESWYAYRNRIMQRAPGIGRAKAAFFVELTCFHKAQLACFDTHMVQLYGFSPKAYGAGKVKKTEFDRMEKHWSNLCAKHGVSSVTARWLVWDEKNSMVTPRAWSRILEHEQSQKLSWDEILQNVRRNGA